MSSNKTLSEKKVLSKQHRRARWPPFWTVLKKFAKGRRVHPARYTRVKRSWRRTKIKG